MTDRLAVARLGTLVRPGGFLIVSVPALPDLFGEFDRFKGIAGAICPMTCARCSTARGSRSNASSGGAMVPGSDRSQRNAALEAGHGPANSPVLGLSPRYLKLPPWPLPWLAEPCVPARGRPCPARPPQNRHVALCRRSAATGCRRRLNLVGPTDFSSTAVPQRAAGPGLSVGRPSSSTSSPLTTTWTIPALYWNGSR